MRAQRLSWLILAALSPAAVAAKGAGWEASELLLLQRAQDAGMALRMVHAPPLTELERRAKAEPWDPGYDEWAPSSPSPATEQNARSYCNAPACKVAGAQKPRLIFTDGGNGCGFRMERAMVGMMMAANAGMQFGGLACPGRRFSPFSHGVDCWSLLENFFGGMVVVDGKSPKACNQSMVDSFRRVQHADGRVGHRGKVLVDSIVDTEDELLEKRRSFKAMSTVFIEPDEMADWLGPHSPTRLTPRVSQAVMEQLQRMPLRFKPGHLAVAVHLRRGDCERERRPDGVPTCWNLMSPSGGFIQDDWYLRIFDQIEKTSKLRPDIHIFSSTEGNRTTETGWTSQDFDVYRKRGYEVHLDDPDLLVPLVHFARADIFISSPSHFSSVPALLNQHCVIVATQADPNDDLDPARVVSLKEKLIRYRGMKGSARFRNATLTKLEGAVVLEVGDNHGSYGEELNACLARSGSV